MENENQNGWTTTGDTDQCSVNTGHVKYKNNCVAVIVHPSGDWSVTCEAYCSGLASLGNYCIFLAQDRVSIQNPEYSSY